MAKTKPGRPPRPPTTWLAIWMAKRRVTARRVAAAVGVSGNSVATWRIGRKRPDDAHKERLAAGTQAIEREQGLATARGVTVADWFRSPPTEAEARKLVPWAFPEPAPEPASPESVPAPEPEKV